MVTGFSFERVDAVDYDELRPGYAPEALRWVMEGGGIDRSSLVIDVAAGTGQLSRLIVTLGCHCVAVEPAQNMRAVLRDRVPGADIVAASAEHLPFADGTVDAAVVGNAFHHFDGDRAFDELRRILRPGGVLALFWARTAADAFDHPVVRRINDMASERSGHSPIADAYRSWYDVHPPVRGFTPFERRRFSIRHVISSRRYADLYATSSDIVALPEHRREALLDEIAHLAESLPETLDLPMESEVDLCRRV